MSYVPDDKIDKNPASILPSRSRTKPLALFAPFSSRLLCTAIDVLIVIILTRPVEILLRDTLGWVSIKFHYIFPVVLLVYFAAFWASRLGATVAQLIWRFKVVNYDGNGLNPWRAVLRSVVLVFLLLAALSIVGAPVNRYIGIAGLASYLLLFLAALTTHRQAAPDLLAHAVVVKRRALKLLSDNNQLTDLMSHNNAAVQKASRPSIFGIVNDALVLFGPLGVLYIAAQTHHDMDMRHRVHYAINETRMNKTAVELYYVEFGKLPENANEIGIGAKKFYPDGGFYYMEPGGKIRIRFSVKPELKNGSIVLTPNFGDEDLTWKCEIEGDIAQQFLPSDCRQ